MYQVWARYSPLPRIKVEGCEMEFWKKVRVPGVFFDCTPREANESADSRNAGPGNAVGAPYVSSPPQRPQGVHQGPYDRTISRSTLSQKVHRECKSFMPINIPAPPSPFLTGHSRQRMVTFWGRDTYQQSDTWNSHRNTAGV